MEVVKSWCDPCPKAKREPDTRGNDGCVVARIRAWKPRPLFRVAFAMGEIRGTLGMRRHISVHRATTKYFSNSFVFKTKIEKEGLPRDSTPDLGAGGPRFKSAPPDQNLLLQRVAEAQFRHCCGVVQVGNNKENFQRQTTFERRVSDWKC